MAEPPLISCIVPVFNGERYLAETLASIDAQTYRPLEVIVVDDGSTDNTARVVEQSGQAVAYHYQANGGPAAARNAGLCHARGPFVAFLDADDLWAVDKLTRQMACFAADDALSLCLTHVRNFWSPELAIPATARADDRLLAPWAGYTCNAMLARRELFDTVGLFNPALIVGEDGDWFMRAAEHRVRHRVLTDVLTYRRLHDNNLTRRMAAESREALLDRFKVMIDRRRSP